MDNNKSDSKHIGILTFHYVLNPGSALQAYALCRTVNELNPSIICEVINYQKKHYRWNRHHMDGHLVLNIIRYLHFSLSLSYFQRFEKKYIKGGANRRIRRSELKNIEKKYNYFIVGSDQVWNTWVLKWEVDDTYFLDFCEDSNKKISYAASLGVSIIPDEDKPRVSVFLKAFHSLAVREPVAQDVINQLIGRRPELVIDPTLLIKKEEWEKLAVYPRMKEDYIFLYVRSKTSEIVSLAKALAKSKGLKIVEYHDSLRKIFSEDKLIRRIEPREWLGWLLNAKYVFTDSFHGAIYCINCKKQFFISISHSQTASRINNVLDRYGMRDRAVYNEKDLFSKKDIDFSISSFQLQKDREDSLDYLRRALGLNEK